MEMVVITGGALIVEEMHDDNTGFLFPILKMEDIDYKELIGGRGLRYLTGATKMALVTTTMAKENAKIEDIISERCGIVVATNFSSIATIVDFDKETITEGPRAVSAMQSPNLVLNATAAKLGMHFDITGFNTTISTGRVSSLDAVDYACNMIHNEEVDMVIVTGVEEMSAELRKWLLETSNMSAEELEQVRQLSGTIILETISHAEKRGARIYGQILDSCSTINGNYLINGGKALDDFEEYSYMISQLVDNPDEIKNICVSDNRLDGKNVYEEEYIKNNFSHAKIISAYDVFGGELIGATGVAQIMYSLQKFGDGKGIVFCNDWTGNFRALLLQKSEVG